MFPIVQPSLFGYFAFIISQIRVHKLIIIYYLIISKKIIHKYSIYYLVRFGSFFITVPSQVQGVFQYSCSFISPLPIRISQSMLTAQPHKKLIAIKLIKIKYFIIVQRIVYHVLAYLDHSRSEIRTQTQERLRKTIL